MDEVIGDLDVLRGTGEAPRLGDVADVEVEAGRLENVSPGAIADQATDRCTRIAKRCGKSGANETGGSSDEGVDGDPLKLPDRPRRATHPASPGCKARPVPAHLLERSQRIELPIERAFAFYGNTHNLEPMTPPWLHFQVTTPGTLTMQSGTLLDYRLKLHGVPVRWRTLIETWEPPLRFVDSQVKGPYSLWEHTHLFEKDGDGATVIHDHVRYELPLGPLGAIAHRLFVRRDLERIFDYRSEAFERLALA